MNGADTRDDTSENLVIGSITLLMCPEVCNSDFFHVGTFPAKFASMSRLVLLFS